MGLIAARIIAFLIASSTITAAAIAQSPPCKTKCGGIDIPYPFGIGEGCYAKEYGDFNVNCTQNSRAFLGNTGNEILSISLNGELRIKAAIGHQCFTPAGANDTYQPAVFLGNRTFTFSHTKNRLFVVGCDTNPWIWDREGTRYSGGCMSYCETADSLKDLDKNDSCSGLGCCGVSIPRGIRRYITGIQSYYRYRNSMSFNRCGYIFLAERDQYKFSIADLTHDGKVSRLILPVVIDWSIGSQSCENAKNGRIVPYACRSANSECIKSNNEIGYFCGCSKGYQGNPYLAGGCRGKRGVLIFFRLLALLLVLREICGKLMESEGNMDHLGLFLLRPLGLCSHSHKPHVLSISRALYLYLLRPISTNRTFFTFSS